MDVIKIGKKKYRKGKHVTTVRTLVESPCNYFLFGDEYCKKAYFDDMTLKAIKGALKKNAIVGLIEVK